MRDSAPLNGLTILSMAVLTVASACSACNASAVAGTERAAISLERIEADVRWLADDAREGRGVLTSGLDEAAAYIAKRFEEMGLEEIEGLEGYFQPFEHPFGRELDEEKTSLAAEGVEDLTLGEDFIPLSWSNPVEFEGELVFAGYGITSERYEWDDYAGLDAEGKVALVLRYEPHKADGQSLFTNSERNSREAALFAKARDAQEAGATALLIVDPPMHREADVELMAFGTGRQRAEIPVFHITRDAAETLLEAAGLDDLEALQKEIDESAAPASEVGQGLAVSGGFDAGQRTIEVKNVIGLLPGRKTDEYIVIGSHYDHVGLGSQGASAGQGEIHNGADDNASGTTAMMALAEAFSSRGEKPERSIVFAAFTAEEIGLVGSRYMTDNPPVPLEQTVAMVNMDMVGRVRDDTLWVGGMDAAPAYRSILEAADENSPLELEDMGADFGGRSDHASFNRRGIPSLFFFTGLHEEYHKPEDDADLINFEGLKQTTELAYEVVEELAGTPREALTFQEPDGSTTRPTTRPTTESATDSTTEPAKPAARRGRDPQETARRVRLGVMPSFESDEGPGVLISGVIEATPADKAGLLPGDRIIRFDDTEIDSLEDLQRALTEAEPGDKATVGLRRDGREESVEITLEAVGD